MPSPSEPAGRVADARQTSIVHFICINRQQDDSLSLWNDPKMKTLIFRTLNGVSIKTGTSESVWQKPSLICGVKSNCSSNEGNCPTSFNRLVIVKTNVGPLW